MLTRFHRGLLRWGQWLALLACSESPHPVDADGGVGALLVQSDCPAWFTEVVLEGAAQWHERVPSTAQPIELTDGQADVHCGPLPWWHEHPEGDVTLAVTAHDGYWRGIWADTDAIPQELALTVALHELGHFYGVVGHFLPPGHVMSSKARTAGVRLTEGDVEELCRHRGDCG